MKAKNVSKNIGKEVVIKVPLKAVTNYKGNSLTSGEFLGLQQPPLTIYDASWVFDDGDVRLQNVDGDVFFVHHKFIKLASKESK